MNKLYAGIDVSSTTNYVYLMKPDGSKHSNFSAKNNPDGSKKIADNIVSALMTLGISAAAIGIEATGVYGDNLMIYLRDESRLSSLQRFFKRLKFQLYLFLRRFSALNF